LGSSHTICVHKVVPKRSRLRISMDVPFQLVVKRDALVFEFGEASVSRARSGLQRGNARNSRAEERARAQKPLDALP
jgi:hypothetical protein